MELIQTILFFAIGITILIISGLVIAGKKTNVGIILDITKYILVALVTFITLSYGKIIAGIVIGLIGFGSLLYFGKVTKK